MTRPPRPSDPDDAGPGSMPDGLAASPSTERGSGTLPRPRVFYGWWIVLACATIIFIAGSFVYGFGAIFDSLVEEFGWSRASIALAFSMRNEVGGLFAPLAGYLVDRLGPRKLLLSGVAAVGLGFLWISRMDALWQLYAAAILIALGIGACGPLVAQVAIANWFHRKRGRAMALLTAGAGASGVTVLVLAWLITLFDWRGAVVMLAVFTWGVGIPLAMVVRRRPEDHGLTPDGEPTPPAMSPEAVHPSSPAGLPEGMTAREALRSRAFWLLSLAFAMSWFGTTAIIVHQIPALTATGFSREAAALVATMTTVGSLVGRLGFGWLADLRDKRLVLASAFLVQSLGMLVFAAVHVWWQLIPFLLLYAPGYGGPIPVRPALQAEYFGRRALGIIMGLTYFISSLGAALGPVFAGWMYDVMDSYRLAFVVAAFMSLAAVPLALSIPRTKLAREGPSPVRA